MIVVDTNILAYHCLPGLASRQTELLLRLDPEWTAPPLWRAEFRNLLCGYMRCGELTEAADTLKGGEHTASDHAVMKLVARSKCTAYNCEFAALAAAPGTVLVTEDKALLSAFPKLCRPPRSDAQVAAPRTPQPSSTWTRKAAGSSSGRRTSAPTPVANQSRNRGVGRILRMGRSRQVQPVRSTKRPPDRTASSSSTARFPPEERRSTGRGTRAWKSLNKTATSRFCGPQ